MYVELYKYVDLCSQDTRVDVVLSCRYFDLFRDESHGSTESVVCKQNVSDDDTSPVARKEEILVLKVAGLSVSRAPPPWHDHNTPTAHDLD